MSIVNLNYVSDRINRSFNSETEKKQFIDLCNETFKNNIIGNQRLGRVIIGVLVDETNDETSPPSTVTELVNKINTRYNSPSGGRRRSKKRPTARRRRSSKARKSRKSRKVSKSRATRRK